MSGLVCSDLSFDWLAALQPKTDDGQSDRCPNSVLMLRRAGENGAVLARRKRWRT